MERFDTGGRETGNEVTGTAGAYRALVFQHLAVEHPGSLGRLLEAGGVRLVTVELDEGDAIPDLDPFDLLIVMGGPMDVWDEGRYPWLGPEKAAIRRWVVDLGRPYLGVCLGHQLLADALGGAVGPMNEPEVGVAEIDLTVAARTDPLFWRLPATIEGLQWHGAEITRLPIDGAVLATNKACAVQAFRVGPHAWGVQCHVEVLETTVAEWASIPTYRAALERSSEDADGLASSVARHLEAMTNVAGLLAASLLERLGAERTGVLGGGHGTGHRGRAPAARR